MSKKQKIILLGVISIILIVVLSISVTTSFMKPVKQGGNLTEISLSSCAKIKLIDEASIDLSNTYPMTENKAMQTKPYKFTITSYCDSLVGFDVYLATLDTNTLDDKNINFILKGDAGVSMFDFGGTTLDVSDNSSTDFSSTELNELNIGIKGTYKNIYKLGSFDSKFKGTSTIELYLYVDENATNETMNQIFKGGIVVKAHDRERKTVATECYDGMNLNDCIYSFASWDSKETSIYSHNSSLANGANDNSLRYSGPSEEVNNFVCFGSDETPCPTDNLYRIIGVFDENYTGVSGAPLVKLIKYDYMTTEEAGTDGDYSKTYKEKGMVSTYKGTYGAGERIGVYYWNYKATNIETNTWSTSLLNKTNLNTNFLNNIGEEWANKIAATTWKVGGNTWAKIRAVVPSVAYQNEIVSPNATNSTDNATEYSAKIGLIYASDYGFAASPSAWTTTLNNYDESDTNETEIVTINWMYMGLYEWTISRSADSSDCAFFVYDAGSVGNSYVYFYFAVRPSFNLESSITYKSGSGTMSDPIRIN